MVLITITIYYYFIPVYSESKLSTKVSIDIYILYLLSVAVVEVVDCRLEPGIILYI